MKKLMILGASILQVPAIRKAKDMGLYVIAVDMDKHAVGFAYADEALVISTIDIDSVLKAAREREIDGIMTLASDMPMRTVAAVSKAMGVAGIDEDTAIRATNKADMRQCLKDHGVPVPVFYRVRTYEDFERAAASFSGPFIVKPADNSGSRGVTKVENPNAGAAVKRAYASGKQYSRDGDLVVEEFMQGQEVSVETLSLEGTVHVIQITDKRTTGAPHFVEMGHSQPTCLSQEIVDRICCTAVDAVKAIGIQNGPSHTEIIVTQDGPKIVELGARLGGDCITTHLVPLSTGVDMVESCIRIALGEKPDVIPKWHRGAAIRYMSSHKGVLKSVIGLEEAEQTDGISQISLVKSPGDAISDICSSADRIGFVIAGGETAQSAASACEEAMAKIRIVIE